MLYFIYVYYGVLKTQFVHIVTWEQLNEAMVQILVEWFY